jgi:hypothetical protein
MRSEEVIKMRSKKMEGRNIFDCYVSCTHLYLYCNVGQAVRYGTQPWRLRGRGLMWVLRFHVMRHREKGEEEKEKDEVKGEGTDID